MPRALLLLGQSPFDPASGAARSMQTLARWLAAAGWRVSSLSTNASEAPHLAAGLSPQQITEAAQAGADTPPPWPAAAAWHWQWQGVRWQWLSTTRQFDWEAECGAAYDAALARQLATDPPDLVLCFGDDPGDRRRRAACRQAGARVVFALHNRAYLGRSLIEVDQLLCPSRHLQAAYQADGAMPAALLHHLPAPVEGDDLGPASSHQPLCLVFANPAPEKGGWLVARIVAELALQQADIPVLVAAGRAGVHGFAAAVGAAGVSVDQLPSLMLAPDGLSPQALLGMARVVLMPSVVAEAAGRMAIEGMAMGAVPVVSNRGALPETVGSGGLVLPLPAAWSQQPQGLPSAQEAAPWVRAVRRLFDDAGHWQTLSAAARQRARHFGAGEGVVALDGLARRWLSLPAAVA